MGDFAKTQLEKFGWKEGQGLGKNGDGMAEPLRVKLKRDVAGVGYSPVAAEADSWWASSYNRAANSISVVNNSSQGTITVSSNCDVGGDVKKRCYDGCRAKLVYRGFLPSQVTQHDIRSFEKEEREGEIEELCPVPNECEKWRVSDSELLKACGGRTAHKAARHGITLSGKLRRLHAQEKLLEQSLVCTNSSTKRTGHKIRHRKKCKTRTKSVNSS